MIKEMSSAGATGAGSVATVVTPLMKKPIKRKMKKEDTKQPKKKTVKEDVSSSFDGEIAALAKRYVLLRNEPGYDAQLERSDVWKELVALVRKAEQE